MRPIYNAPKVAEKKDKKKASSRYKILSKCKLDYFFTGRILKRETFFVKPKL